MATTRQKRVAQLIIANTKLDEPLNGGEMLERVRYSKGIQKQPSRILESKGVLEELDNLGFNVESAKKVVAQILQKGREENRLRAAQEIFKVSGEYAPEKHLVVTKKIISVDE